APARAPERRGARADRALGRRAPPPAHGPLLGGVPPAAQRGHPRPSPQRGTARTDEARRTAAPFGRGGERPRALPRGPPSRASLPPFDSAGRRRPPGGAPRGGALRRPTLPESRRR